MISSPPKTDDCVQNNAPSLPRNVPPDEKNEPLDAPPELRLEIAGNAQSRSVCFTGSWRRHSAPATKLPRSFAAPMVIEKP